MADTLAHRGPDEVGEWVDPAVGLALGFRRLAVIDLTPTGHQPMISSDGRYVIAFNGEVYNYRDLRAELENHGRVFRGYSDTEVILEGASQWGIEAIFARIWGMFAIALWDREEQCLILARDRVGKKPLYYEWAGGHLVFGSELKALRVHPLFCREIDRNAVAAYLRYGYVPAPLSIYRGARKLLPANYAVFHRGTDPIFRCYWEARGAVEQGLRDQCSLPAEEAIGELDTLLRDSVARRMISDVPLGALLSGGIDSSAVVALMQAQSIRPIRTFTIGFHLPGYNEAESAKAVAKHLGTSHTELYVSPDEAQAVIPRLPDLYDEPFADSSQIPTLLVCSLARKEVTVSLSGDGGDEVFGGYTRYVLAERIWKVLRRYPSSFRRLASRAIQGLPPRTWENLYLAVEPILPSAWRFRLPGEKLQKLADLLAVSCPDGLYLQLVSHWKSPKELTLVGSEDDPLQAYRSIAGHLSSLTVRMMFLDLTTYLPDDILVKVDRASMGVSLEARCPFLDHRVIEWTWRLPMAFKQRGNQGKWLLRKLLHRYVPQELVSRPKMGFGVPIDSWLRGSLRDWAEALLDEGRLKHQGLLNPRPVRQAWAEHLAGRREQQHRLWIILMLQAWHERWST